MRKNYFLLVYFLFSTLVGVAQYKQLSNTAEVSIITAGPGTILYEGFGHSAIRIKDTNFDLVYNYGFFDFNAPNFYLNFAKGRLLYKLERYPFHYFLRSYQKDKRWVKEQLLNLTQKEKQQFFEYLENNAKPENATYFYDPFYNNCATKLREITEIVLKDNVRFKDNHINTQQSFRQLMNQKLPWNTWGSFGINLALGSKLDKVADAKEHMYLPDFVYIGFNNATVNRDGKSENLVKTDRTILKFDELRIKSSVVSPIFVFCLISLLGIFITYKDVKRRKRTKWLDFVLFFTTGLLGVLVLLLWFFTNHSTTPNNFNFLWAFAPNLIVAFMLSKTNNWIKKYIWILIVLLVVIPFIWFSKIQLFSLAILPLLLLLIVRYVVLVKYLLPSKK
ncbi:MAG: DUF4105 domain-containing protein [Flavobacteriaceae bacterium]|nr:DUF4105 domain-containing protein [Flavobacteriaceae bacterium]